LEREADVDERRYDLDRVIVLSMVEEVALAALVRWMPVEDVELRRSSCILT
jgi:hypothetical protein